MAPRREEEDNRQLRSRHNDENDEGYDSNTKSDEEHLPRGHQYIVKPAFPIAENKVKVEEDSSKRRKLNNEDVIHLKESSKKYGTYRLWSEDDEITVLKSMLNYHSERGVHPFADMGAFHEFVKNSLRIVGVSKSQLIDKIKRLKKKYQNNVEKREDLVFLKPHEENLFNISKKIWGTEADNAVDDSSRPRKNYKADKSEALHDHEAIANGVTPKEKGEQDDFWSLFPRLKESLQLGQFSMYSLPDSGKNFLKERLSSIGRLRATELEDKWSNLQKAETKVNLMRAQLIQDQTKLIFEAMK